MQHAMLTPVILIMLMAVSWPSDAFAHCDGIDGPVVKAAQEALRTGDVTPVLIWVQEKDEPEIRELFVHTMNVRSLGAEARKLADTYFFETVVRLHRAGEGAPYTGLKPGGRDLGPAIPAADASIEDKSARAVLDLLTDAVRQGLHSRFEDVMKHRTYDRGNVDAGRRFVSSYVSYVHFVEGVYALTDGARDGQPDAHRHE